jgi:hypothetical protein
MMMLSHPPESRENNAEFLLHFGGLAKSSPNVLMEKIDHNSPERDEKQINMDQPARETHWKKPG